MTANCICDHGYKSTCPVHAPSAALTPSPAQGAEECAICRGKGVHQVIRVLSASGWHIVDCPHEHVTAVKDRELAWVQASAEQWQEIAMQRQRKVERLKRDFLAVCTQRNDLEAERNNLARMVGEAAVALGILGPETDGGGK